MTIETPLHEATSSAGAIFENEGGYQLPGHYADVAGEYTAACSGAAVFDISNRGKIRITGADAKTFLHNLTTNDVNGLGINSGCEGFLTSGQAKVEGHALIYHLKSSSDQFSYWLDVAPGTAENAINHLSHYLIAEDVEMSDQTKAHAQIHLAGPKAREILEVALKVEQTLMTELQAQVISLGATMIQVRRHDPLGVPGYDLICEGPEAATIWNLIKATGAQPAGLNAYQILRIEAGTPVYGLDIDNTNLPQEIGRTEKTISFTKGCYIGQETIARIRTYGHVNRLLMGVKFQEAVPVARLSKIFHQGKEVGHVTSAVLSPRLGAIGLCYLRRGGNEPGTAVAVDNEGKQISGEVSRLPFEIRSS